MASSSSTTFFPIMEMEFLTTAAKNTSTTPDVPTSTTQVILDDETLYIIIGSLSGMTVVLVAILLVIFCARKKSKRLLNSSVKDSAVPGVINSRNVEEGYMPRVAAGGGFVNEAAIDPDDYIDMNNSGIPNHPPPMPGDHAHIASGSYAEIDENDGRSAPRAAPRSSTSSNKSRPIEELNEDYINTEGVIYENYTTRVEKQSWRPVPAPPSPAPPSPAPPSPAPQSPEAVEKEPPALPRKRSSDSNMSSSNNNNNLFRRGTKAFKLYNNAPKNYEVSEKSLTLTHKLGKGHFGTVYEGVAAKLPYSDKTSVPVAVKTMKVSASDADKQEFLYEFEIMKLTNSLNHENIIKLLGTVTKRQPCMIVLELMPGGNLRNFLRASRCQDTYYNLHSNSNSLTERQLLQFAIDIANGMEGIADLQLLHRDLAARNILLDANLRCKISDFGFAKDILNKPEYKSKSVFHRARPVRWLPPESILYFKHNIMSDVWSYGIVLWEIVTLGNLPYPNMKVREVRVYCIPITKRSSTVTNKSNGGKIRFIIILILWDKNEIKIIFMLPDILFLAHM